MSVMWQGIPNQMNNLPNGTTVYVRKYLNLLWHSQWTDIIDQPSRARYPSAIFLNYYVPSSWMNKTNMKANHFQLYKFVSSSAEFIPQHSKPMTLVRGGGCHYIGWLCLRGGWGAFYHIRFLLERGDPPLPPYWFTVLTFRLLYNWAEMMFLDILV